MKSQPLSVKAPATATPDPSARHNAGSAKNQGLRLFPWIFAVVVAVLLSALTATLFWLFSETSVAPLRSAAFAVHVSGDKSSVPGDARARLQHAPLQNRLTTNFSTADYWLQFAVPEDMYGNSNLIELDSRHLGRATCFDEKDQLIGTANRNEQTGAIKTLRRGYSVLLPANARHVLCKLSFDGPARFTSSYWSAARAHEANLKFQTVGGLIDGAMVALAFFACAVAVFNQSLTPLIYAAWLIINARLASLSAGMDFMWMTWEIPAVYLPWMRKGEVACYIILSLALVQLMFKREIRHLGLQRGLRKFSAMTMAVVSCAYVFTYPWAIQISWVMGTLSALVLTWVLIRIAMDQRSAPAIICVAGWVIAFVAQMHEVVAAFLGADANAWYASSIGASVASILLVAATIAIQVRGDRAARTRDRHKVLQALQLVQRTYQNVPLGLFTVNADGRIQRQNPSFEAMLGLSPGAPATTWKQCFPEVRIAEILGQALAGGVQISDKDKTFRLSAVEVKGAFECTLTDVTAEARDTARLSYLVDHDALTGALNRRGLNTWADHAHREKRWGNAITFAYVDLQRFKLINDLFGYSTGDAVLSETARRLEGQIFKEGAWLARLGGDQFLVVFERWSESDVRATAARIVEEIADRTFDIKGNRVNVGVSVGLILVDRSLTLAEALSAADYACALAKRSKERVYWAVANPRQIETYRAEQKLARSFEEKLPVDRFFLEFQPIVSLSKPSSSLSAEVLIRMRGDNGHPVSPGRFLPIAERLGLMSQIDWWVLTQTSDWFAKHPDSTKAFDYIAVNLSGTSLNDGAFLEKVVDYMHDHKWLAGKLLFEITESIALRDVDITNQFVERMKSLGVRIGLDDFGAGYTSFSYLQAFPADILKLDGNFVRDASANLQNHRIIRSIVDLAHQLEMSCVAEWAENAELVKILHDLGADYAQGWGLCKAINPREFIGTTNALQLIENPTVRDFLMMVEQHPGRRLQSACNPPERHRQTLGHHGRSICGGHDV